MPGCGETIPPPLGFQDREVISPPPRFDHHKRLDLPCCYRTIEAFEFLHVIGKGLYGVVYKARDLTNGEVVAIKHLKMDAIPDDVSWMCLPEIKYMHQCQRHPSIIRLKEVVLDHDDTIHLVMEYAESDLYSMVRDKPHLLDEGRVQELMRQLLQGVAHLHSTGIVHNDLKTSNLLVTKDGSLKICDFGLSRPLSGDGSRFKDLRAVGYIMAELTCKESVWNKLVEIFCTSDDRAWRNMLREMLRETIHSNLLSSDGLDLLTRLFALDSQPITAEDALQHHWFSDHGR